MENTTIIEQFISDEQVITTVNAFSEPFLPLVKEYIDLNHVLEDNMITFPGLSEVKIFHKAGRFENGALIDGISFLGISSTYIDAPYHADAQGKKICDYKLEQLVNLPIIVVILPEDQSVFDIDLFAGINVTGKAVLLYSGRDKYFGTEQYIENPPYLSTEAAEWLVEQKAKLVGIDSLLIDNLYNDEQSIPVHDILLENDIVIAEDMTNIGAVLGKNAYLTAVPPRAPLGSFPTRIFATVY